MNRLALPVSFCLLVFGSCVRAQDDAKPLDEGVAAIRQVTLYRDRALVTREVLVPAGEKFREVLVPDLPELVVADSVYADGDEHTIVRAVRVSPRLAAESRREEVSALNKQLDDLDHQRAEVQHALDVVTKNIELLGQLVNFSVVSGQSDLNRGVLDAETLTKLATYSMTEGRDMAAEQFQHQQQLQALAKQIQQATWNRDLATKGQQTANYQAKIFVETEDGLAGMVRLSYLVTGCNWSPQYTVRGSVGKRSFDVRYSALVQQMSGEDWEGVRLVLSTASPSVSAARPLLTPLRVTSVEPSIVAGRAKLAVPHSDPFAESAGSLAGDQPDSLTGMVQTLRTQQRQAESTFDLGRSANSSDQRDLALNSLAGQLQEIELQAEAKSLRTLAPDVDEDVASQVYTLSQPVSLDARREQQLVQILETELAGEMYHVATPLLSTFAYREAEMTNTQPIGLLGGPATIYLDDRFVGRTQIPSTASGQRLTIGFGADQQVRTRRELLDKQDVVQGGNRQLKFVYRLVLSNFKNEPVAVRLMDRLPNTQQAQQLSVRLEDPKQPLSDDALYRRILQPTGILRWDLAVPEGRNGSQAFDVNYTYTMEFDRSRVPTTHHALDELQAGYRDVNFGSEMGGGFGGGGFGSGGTN
ncbi:MAG: DUF4139 domain-containing protein [Planctomycetota bacterium]|nr:DUF4139 domain-containing protein [Planctomycetota bacterium]